jgi:hypothetical protein
MEKSPFSMDPNDPSILSQNGGMHQKLFIGKPWTG